MAPDVIVLGVLLACRVNSIYRMLGWGTIPLGALAGGFLADAAGLRAPYIVAGIVRGVTLLAALPALVAASKSRASV